MAKNIQRLAAFTKTATMLLCIAALATVDSFSQVASSTFSSAFIQRPQGARPTGMAGAFTAVANDPLSLYYNPAGLSFVGEDPMMVFSYSNYGNITSNGNIAYAQQMDDHWGIGAGISGITSQQFQGYDINLNQTNMLRSLQSSIYLGSSYQLSDISLGGAIKYFRSDLVGGEAAGQGFALDLGTKFNVLDYFTVGASVQNIGGYMIWNSDMEQLENLPYTVRFGAAMEFGLNDEEYVTRKSGSGELQKLYVPATRYVLVSMETVINQFDPNPNIILATEAVLHEMFAIRGGLAIYGSDFDRAVWMPLNIWGGGLSFRPEFDDLDYEFQFDYSISSDYINELGINHNLSIQVLF